MAEFMADEEEIREELEDDDTELFVQEDLVEGEDDEDDDLEAKITEEHVKFKEAQAEYQKQVRAARPWSAPPLGSPRPEKQRKREAEQLETLQESSSTLGSPSVSERNEYIPPERPQVERAAAKGGSSLSYMAPPRPMSADTIRSAHRLSHASSSKSASLQDIPEGAILVAAAASATPLPQDPPPGDGTDKSPFSQAAAQEASRLPSGPEGEEAMNKAEEDDDGIYSDNEDGDDEDVDLSTLDSLLSGKLGSRNVPATVSTVVPVTGGNGGVWVVQSGANPEEGQEDGAGAEPTMKTEGPKASEPATKAALDDEVKGQSAVSQTLDPNSSLISSPTRENPSPSSTIQIPTSWQGDKAAAASSLPPNSSTTAKITASSTASEVLAAIQSNSSRPMTTPASRSASLSTPFSRAGPAVQQEQQQPSDGGSEEDAASVESLLNPHAFALQLLAHDLGVLPPFQAAAVAAASRREASGSLAAGRAPAGVTSLAQVGYLGLGTTGRGEAASRPLSAPAYKRPSSAAPKGSVTRSAISPPQGPRKGSASSQRAPELRRNSVDSIGAEVVMQVSRALRASPSARDRIMAAPFSLIEGVAPGSGKAQARPAAARQRPASARPAYSSVAPGGGGYGRSSLVAGGAGPSGMAPPAGRTALPRRPMSAQPASRAYNREHSWDGDNSLMDGESGRPLSPNPQARAATAEVDVSGKNVSVYVAETMKRIAEANRYLAVIGSSRQYRLKDSNSNMVLELVAPADSYPAVDSIDDWEPAPEMTVIKTISLRQFLSSVIRLKGQAAAASRKKDQDQPLSRPLPSKYDVYEIHADRDSSAGGITFQEGSIQDQLSAAAARCEELAEQVRLLRRAELAL